MCVFVLLRASLGKRLQTEGVGPLTTFHSSSLGNKEMSVTLKKVGHACQLEYKYIHNQVFKSLGHVYKLM